MRRVALIVLWSGWAAVASAQTSTTPPPAAAGPLPPIGLPLPSIGLPLPPIGLPLAPIGLPPAPDSEKRRPPTKQGPSGGTPTVGLGGSTVFFVPTYPWVLMPGQIAPAPPDTPTKPAQPAPLTGTLRLEIQPARAQLFVDGQFVGTPEDFNNELELEAGSHALEVRAQGFETLVVAVKIPEGRAITYTGSMKRLPVEPEARPARAPKPDHPEPAKASQAPRVPSTFYFIPGCYLGNVPPEQVPLPATCDMSRLVTRTQ